MRRLIPRALRAFRHDSTGVLIGPISIERQGDRLIATFTMTLTGGNPMCRALRTDPRFQQLAKEYTAATLE